MADKRQIYRSKAKRIAFFVVTAVAIALLFGASVYLTGRQFLEQNYLLFSAGFLVSVVFMVAFSVTMQEMTRAIQRRGYARPVGPSQLDKAVKWFVPVTEPEPSHPTQYQRSKIPVPFDNGDSYEVDTGKLYFVLLAEQEHTGGILTWERCVIKGKMDKRAWAAYRQVLIQAEVVEIDGRGSMRLNCQPWAAVEVVKQRC